MNTEKRGTSVKTIRQAQIVAGDLTMSLGDRSVSIAGEFIPLTTAEFNMLELLLRNPGNTVSKEELTEGGLARKLELHDRSVDMHISNLRKKLGPMQCGGKRIKTARGIGYVYSANPGSEPVQE